jgi:hypothetical protein
VTIADDRSAGGLFEFEDPTYTVDQDGGLVTVNVVRHGGAGTTGTAYVETADGMAQGLEYGYNGALTFVGYHNFVNKRASLVFGPNDTKKSFTIRVLNNDFTGPSLDFLAKIESAMGASIGETNLARIEILNPNAAENPAVEFEKPGYDFDEDAGNVTVRFRRAITGNPDDKDHQIKIKYKIINASAKNQTDLFVGGSSSVITSETAELTIESGSTYADLPLSIADRAGQQGNRTLSLQIIEATDLTASKPVGTLANTIVPITVHDLDNPYGVFEFNSASYSANDSSGSVTVTIARRGNLKNAATVRLQTEDGNAANNVDYYGGSLTVKFTPGMRSFNVTIPLVNLSRGGTVEFYVNLTPLHGAGAGAVTQTTVNVTDN